MNPGGNIRLTRHPAAGERDTSRSGRIGFAALFALATIMTIFIFTCPAGASGSGPDNPGNLSLTITYLNDGDVLWIDVVPPHAAVVGRAESPGGIKSIFVSSDNGEVSCGNESEFACSVPVSRGENTITVTAEDNSGRIVEEVLNVTVNIGLPPPPSITIRGRVIDTNGDPVPGAEVLFESDFALNEDKEPLTVTNISGADGTYLIEDQIGYGQNIVVQKGGYLTYRAGVVFEEQNNRLDFSLEPQEKESPGFGLPAVLCALGLILIFFAVRKRAGSHDRN